jgi:tetratricopeptide (TPR) repeat protein
MEREHRGELEALQEHLYSLVDDDPIEAIAQASDLVPGDSVEADQLSALQASIYVDAGADTKNVDVIARGVHIFRHLVANLPDRLDLRYNLANGLSAVAQQHRRKGPQWYLETAFDRWEARALYRAVAEESTDEPLCSRAWANLGNLLQQSFRWIEAYEAYLRSIHANLNNAIALSGAAKVLRTCADWRIGPTRQLRELAESYLARAGTALR